MREVWPACLVSGLSLLFVQFLVSNYMAVGGRHRRSLASILSLMCCSSFGAPHRWRFADEQAAGTPDDGDAARPFGREAAIAWMPWIFYPSSYFSGTAAVQDVAQRISNPQVPVPYLHKAIFARLRRRASQAEGRSSSSTGSRRPAPGCCFPGSSQVAARPSPAEARAHSGGRSGACAGRCSR